MDDTSASEIKALVHLLDDPDTEVQETVQSRLDALGSEALPVLRQMKNEVADDSTRDRIGDVVHRLHWDQVEEAWNTILTQEEVNLERGAFVLALYRFPQLDIQSYQRRIDAFAEEIRADIQTLDGPERALRLAEFMTGELGFEGNREHYYDPNNSYLNRVLDRRLGIPISLSVLYVLLGQRLDLPVCGVNMPAHYLTKYADSQHELFLDLFNGGKPIPKEDCVRFLLKAGIRPLPFYFQCAEPKDTLLRMARNLLAIAQDAQQEQTASELMRLIAPHDPSMDLDETSE